VKERITGSNKGMKLTKLSAAWLPGWTCRLMPAPPRQHAGTDVWRSRADGGVIPDDWARPGEVPLVVVPQLVVERGSMTRAALLMPFDATWSFMVGCGSVRLDWPVSSR
jgi:hypothetical protein